MLTWNLENPSGICDIIYDYSSQLLAGGGLGHGVAHVVFFCLSLLTTYIISFLTC